VLSVTSLTGLREFIEADPYYGRYPRDFERVFDTAAGLFGGMN